MVILKLIHVQNYGYEPLNCMHTILSMWPMVFTIFLKFHKTLAVDHGIVCIHYLASHQWFHQGFIFVKNLRLYPRLCGHKIHPLPCFTPMVSPVSRRLHKTMAVDHGIVCIHYLASHQWFYHHFFTSISMVHSHGYWRTLDHASHRRFVRVIKLSEV